MQFTDLTFLFIFLPMVLVFFYISKGKYRSWILLIFSLFFYACGSPDYFILLCAMTMANVCIGSGIIYCKNAGTKKGIRIFLCVIGILLNISVLGYYKYCNFAIENMNTYLGTQLAAKDILLPLGISFYAFKAISYLVDSYRGKIDKIQPIYVATYLTFFGQIQSGPIARYETFDFEKMGGGASKVSYLQVAQRFLSSDSGKRYYSLMY